MDGEAGGHPVPQDRSAHHVQAAATRDFRKPLFDRLYDEVEAFIIERVNPEVGTETVRASGVLRDERLTLHINGVPVKIAEDGTFTLTDPKGNQTHVSRHVLRL